MFNKNEIKTKKYNIFAKNISHFANNIIFTTSSYLGFPKNFIQHWNNAIGSNSQFIKPVKMSLNTKKNEYILHVLINDLAFWSTWKMMESSVVSKIEEILNKKCTIKVDKI
ncbi:hypothetical protein [Candidatus Deianiraea vastatrix]|uniref:Uncharacterized protein n=1 Tax=Candidatus Deianiraea vastatrix TaxID=2163644 RepID=A0A5B8XDB7_9RICK|nr:hypothetical protein [Candidatus Deianiraea vastatrix]QED23359.1 hypothetical protein Deia_00564 [Candidatus Deianiraea vastatrix]